MAFVYLYTKDGTTPQTKYYPAAEVTFTKVNLAIGILVLLLMLPIHLSIQTLLLG